MDIGIIIIGNEILSGRTADVNSTFLARRLFARGAKVREIATIPDEVEVVAEKVREFSGRFGLVVTTGGIGPTHDDVTYEGVARGLGVGLVQSAELRGIILRKIPTENDAVRKLATLPEGAVLLFGSRLVWPPVKVANVVVLPGIPSLIESQFDAVEQLVPACPFCVTEVKCFARETELAQTAARVSRDFPDVEVGSYPMAAESGKHVLIRFTGTQGARTQGAVKAFLAGLPEGIVTSPPETVA